MLFKKKQFTTEAEFDIEGLYVFSIERDDDGRTLFGYSRDGQEMEWCVKSTDEQHQAFVRRLTAKLAKGPIKAEEAPNVGSN